MSKKSSYLTTIEVLAKIWSFLQSDDGFRSCLFDVKFSHFADFHTSTDLRFDEFFRLNSCSLLLSQNRSAQNVGW